MTSACELTGAVLLIEDDPFHADLFRLAWDEAKLRDRLVVVASGDTALGLLGVAGDTEPPEPPLLVLLDLNLPGRDGHEILAAIRADDRFATIPVVILSTSSSPDDQAATAAAGADSYVVKPPRYADLVIAARRIAEQWLDVTDCHDDETPAARPTDDAPPALRVMIIDDHSLLVEALRLSLADRVGDACDDGRHIHVMVAASLDHDDVLSQADTEQPDVVLVDLDLGRGRNGGDLVAPLTRAGHRVIMFTGSTTSSALGAGLEAGAAGLIRKTDPFDHLLVGIGDAARGRNLIRPAERDELVAEWRRSHATATGRADRLASLTPREHAVLARLADGSTPTEIAAQSVVAIATVRSQIKSILRKLDVTSQLAAVAIARGD